MKLRLMGLALLCGASFGARADAEHDRIASERAAANARLAERERECATRFVVATCIDDARNENRATLGRLRQETLQLDEGRRHAAAEARRKAIAEKPDRPEPAQGRASDASPEAPRVRVRRAPQAQPSPENRPVDSGASAAAAGSDAAAGASRKKSIEQHNQQAFDARQREISARRDEVARRNAARAAKGKVAAPLPPGASAPR